MLPNNDNEVLPVVDECGNILGSALRKECHSGSMLLHPVVHLHVISDAGILLQKRSLTKKIQPGKWDTAVGGHISLGECVATALRREAVEEIGLIDFDPKPVATYEMQSDVERELVYCNIFKVGDEFMPHREEEEADELRFWPIDEVESNLGKGIFTPNFEQEYAQYIKPYLND